MSDVQALSVGLELDLAPLSRYLWRLGVPHQISERAGRQVVWTPGEAEAELVREAFRRFQEGRLQESLRDEVVDTAPAPASASGMGLFSPPAPLTLLLLVLSIAGYLLVTLDRDFSLVRHISFFDFEQRGRGLLFSLPEGQPWRLVTPVFLHFSLLHITFNGLWLWDLGRRVEVMQGTVHLFGLFLIIGVGSNMAQAVFAGVSIFGGMSGVIYGLLGYCWVWSRLRGDDALAVPGPILALMIGWLLFCLAGFSELLGLGAVANAAHVGGLLMGALLGGLSALLAGPRRA